MIEVETLRRAAHWVRFLTPAEVVQVAQAAHEGRAGIGEYVVQAGDTSRDWIGVLQGLVKMAVNARDGRTSSLTGISAGGWFGEGSLLKRERLRYDIVALRETRLIRVPAETFELLVSTSLPFNRFLLDQLNARLSLFIGILEHDRLWGTEARVAHCIADLFEPMLYPHADPLLDITQEEVAHLCGLSRQRTNRALKALEQQGLVKLDFHRIQVLELGELRTLGRDDNVREVACERRDRVARPAGLGAAGMTGLSLSDHWFK